MISNRQAKYMYRNSSAKGRKRGLIWKILTASLGDDEDNC